MSKFCSNCGSPLEEGVKFCPSCGSPCAAADNTAQPEPVPYAAAAGPSQEELMNRNAQPAPVTYNQNSGQQYQQYPAPPAPQQPQYAQQPQYGQNQQYPQYTPYSNNAYQAQPKKKSKAGLIVAIVIGALIILSILGAALSSLLSGSGKKDSDNDTAPTSAVSDNGNDAASGDPEKPIEMFVEELEGIFNGDGSFSNIRDYVFEYVYIEDAYKDEIEEAFETSDETMSEVAEIFDSLGDTTGDDSDIDLSFVIEDWFDMDEEDIEDFIEDIELDSVCDVDVIEEMRDYTVTIYMDGKGYEDEEFETYYIAVAKAGGKWYLLFSGIE